MRGVRRGIAGVGVLAVLWLSAPAGAETKTSNADTPPPAQVSETITVTPTVIVYTDSQGRPVRTETQVPSQSQTSAPATVTVTVTPPNPGVKTLGANDAGQWIGMLIGVVLGTLGTIAVSTRRSERRGLGAVAAGVSEVTAAESESSADSEELAGLPVEEILESDLDK